MATYHRFILLLWLVYGVTIVLLAVAGATQWDLYYAVFLIEYLSLTTVFGLLNPPARAVLSRIGLLLVPGFVVAVGLRVLDVLGILS